MLYVGINNAGRQNLGMSALLRVLHPFDPNHQEIDDARLAFRGNLSSFGNFPPLFKTASAAGCRCVLSLEDGMSAHGSLSSVVRRICRRKACADEVGGMAPYRRHAFIRNILSVCRRKPEPGSELRSCKLRERFINSHLSPRNHQPFSDDSSNYTIYFLNALNQGAEPCHCARKFPRRLFLLRGRSITKGVLGRDF